VFQDVFHMGQALERRLAEIDIASGPVAGSDSGDPRSVARGAIAELRNWAGSVTVQVSGTAAGLNVVMAGDDYSDFGLSGAGDPNLPTVLTSAFGFVYGPPWVAECAAHIRKDCPQNFDANWVQHPSLAVDSTNGSTDYYDTYGAINPVFTLTVPYFQGTVPNFQPPGSAIDAPSDSHLYMVRLNDPKSPGNRGVVLGVIRPDVSGIFICPPFGPCIHIPGFGPGVTFAVAPMQRELLEDSIERVANAHR
jgi:hypothetical protein